MPQAIQALGGACDSWASASALVCGLLVIFAQRSAGRRPAHPNPKTDDAQRIKESPGFPPGNHTNSFPKMQVVVQKNASQTNLQLCYVQWATGRIQTQGKQLWKGRLYAVEGWDRHRFRNIWNGRWWVHVRFCSVRCEGIYEVKQNDAANWHTFPRSRQYPELTIIVRGHVIARAHSDHRRRARGAPPLDHMVPWLGYEPVIAAVSASTCAFSAPSARTSRLKNRRVSSHL